MKTIIAGCRDISDFLAVETAANESHFDITEVVSGGADGVDTNAIDWAIKRGIPYRVFEADWKKHGKAAGPIRNGQMAKYAEALVLVWDGESRGSFDMLKQAFENKLKIFVRMWRK